MKNYFPRRRQKDPIEIFWCGNLNQKRGEKWSFPPQVERYLRQWCEGKSTLHLFGGRAKFGTRIDMDPHTQPDIIADAFLPPFARRSFDVVILDPPYRPYMDLGPDTVRPLLMNASWIARSTVIWFAPVWIDGYTWLRLERSYFVRVAAYAEPRMLQFLRPTPPKDWKRVERFTRGPAIRYNKWLAQPQQLPFGSAPHGTV